MSPFGNGKFVSKTKALNSSLRTAVPKFLLLLLFIFPTLLFAQKGTISLNPKKLSKEELVMVETAHNFYEEGEYLLALPYYEKLYAAHPSELFFKYKLGTCYLYKSDSHDKALEQLRSIYEQKPEAPDINYFLGRAYFLNYKFDDAIAQFNKYLDRSNIPAERKKEAQRFIENCSNAKELIAHPVQATITNIGSPVNTAASEYVPVISADQSVLVFTYRGEESTGGLQGDEGYFEDVFISYKTDGTWSKPVSIGENINTYGHDAAIALSPDGKKLFIYKNASSDKGDIYLSRLEGKSWGTPERLKGSVNTLTAWEGSVSLSPDEKIIYFSSERSGGFGGKDLYRAELMADGTWGNVMNLGPGINTPYDDDAPFIHPDGRTMYFSSSGHNSMGGYDIFKTELTGETWSAPVNIGYPINTPGDDIYFVLAANGTTGYYASGKAGGAGQQDIYTIDIPQNKSVLMLVKGNVTLDDQPVEAMVNVTEEPGGQPFTSTTSDAGNGKYVVTLPGGKNYRLTYRLAGQDSQTVVVNAVDLAGYLEKTIDIKFGTKSTTATKLQSTTLTQADTAKPTTAVTNNSDPYASIANKSAEGLVYKVQIAAYRLPDNFKFKNVTHLGKVEKLDLDGITRFTMGSFNTLAEAEVLKKKVREAGITDAFVTAIYKGKRVYLEDLIKQDIFPK